MRIEGLEGCAIFTVRVAGLLVTFPVLSVTTTVNDATLSEDVVIGVVYDTAVALLIAVPFFPHWYESGGPPVAVTANVVLWPAVTIVHVCLVVAHQRQSI